MHRSRRRFLRSAAAAAVATSSFSWLEAAVATSSFSWLEAARAAQPGAARRGARARTFRLAYAPHFGMFEQHAGPDLVSQLEFMASEGFTAIEDNGLSGRPVEVQERIGDTLSRLGMRMGVFVGHRINWTEPTLTLPDRDKRDAFLADVRASVEVAKRVSATWMTVVPGHVDRRLHVDFQTANVVDALRRAADLLEPHRLVMVLEPLNTLRNHPGMFLTTTPQAYLVCKAVASPSCKILYDIYHQQITEGNLIPNIDAAWDEIGYFQLGDNPGRNEPGTGEINFRNVFKHIHARGYTGIVGMEHGNAAKGREGERAVIDAYVTADSWA